MNFFSILLVATITATLCIISSDKKKQSPEKIRKYFVFERIEKYRTNPYLIFSLNKNKTNVDDSINPTDLQAFTKADYITYLPDHKPEFLITPYFKSGQSKSPLDTFEANDLSKIDITPTHENAHLPKSATKYHHYANIYTHKIYAEKSSYGESYAANIGTISSCDFGSESYYSTRKQFIVLKNKQRLALQAFPILPPQETIRTVYDRFFIEALCGFVQDKKNFLHEGFWRNGKDWFISYPLIPLAWRLQRCLAQTDFDDKTKDRLSAIITSSIRIPSMGYQFLRDMSPLFPTIGCGVGYYGISCLLPQWHITTGILAGTAWLISNALRYLASQEPPRSGWTEESYSYTIPIEE
jgi:hypothetical protein